MKQQFLRKVGAGVERRHIYSEAFCLWAVASATNRQISLETPVISTLLLRVSDTSNIPIFIFAQLTSDWNIFARFSAKTDAWCKQEHDGTPSLTLPTRNERGKTFERWSGDVQTAI